MSETKGLKEDLRGNYTGNFLQDALTDLYTGSNVSRDASGNVRLDGLAWWAQPFAPNAKKVAETNLDLQESQATDKAVAGTRFTRSELRGALNGAELTPDNVLSASARLVKAEGDKDKATTRSQAVEDQATAHQQGLEVLAEQGKQSSEQLAAQIAAGDRRAADTNRLTLAQMQLSQLQANNQFEIAQMNNRLQMRREDAREARLERKDRMSSIQQLMAGLAQMGASIAI